jgi:hypothetical protein
VCVRFNPPPTWPRPAEGWSPPPGWLPDRSWPPPPHGWPLWVEDDEPPSSLPAKAPEQAAAPVSELIAEAYGSKVSLVGSVLTVTATNLVSRGALQAKSRAIDIRLIRAATWNPPTALQNGTLAVVTEHGKTLIRFRKKQADQLRIIFSAIAAAAPPSATSPVAESVVDAAKLALDDTTAEDLAAAQEDDAEELRALVTASREFDGADEADVRASGFLLQAGERLYGRILGAVLIEPRRAPGKYVGASSGISFRLARNVRYSIGQQRGLFVPGPDSPTVLDTGDVAITTQRVLFSAPKASREWRFDKLISVDHSPDGSWTALALRQRTSGFGYGADAADEVRFRLDLALSVYRGDRDSFLEQLERELDRPRP